MKSVMQHAFSQVPKVQIQRSSFNRSHGCKMTMESGYLIPFFVDEVLPGDSFNLRTAGFARMSTPLYPVMDNVFLETFYFFVPNRLVWDNWVKMMGEQKNPGDSTDFTVPRIASPGAGGFANESIYDYFGLPTQVNFSYTPAMALPFRAYNLIWNEWFRDQNLQNSVTVKTDDTNDPVNTYTLLRRGKRHDYFTSCLPWPQKGDAVDIPLGSTAPVINDPAGPGYPQYQLAGAGALRNLALSGSSQVTAGAGGTGNLTMADPNMIVDLSGATATTINELRTAFQVQKMLERDARGGTRYIEMVRSHFGVISPMLVYSVLNILVEVPLALISPRLLKPLLALRAQSVL